jgi:hypothetical protein
MKPIMQNQFEKFIQNLLADKYDILPDAEIQFNPEEESEEEILKTINLSFLILLAGSKHPQYKNAQKLLIDLKSKKEFGQIVEFYSIGAKLVESEIKQNNEKDNSIAENFEQLNDMSFDTHSYEQIVEQFWSLFFPEGKDLFDSDKRREKVNLLRETRKISISDLNLAPIKNPVQEMLFTSNVLLTIPLDSGYLDNENLSDNLKQHLKNIQNEKQKYWYDHPIPMGIEPTKNEVLYGLSGLSDMLQFEKSRGNAQVNDKLDCLLSVSVTHEGLHEIIKEYLRGEISKSKSIKGLNVYVFTENETKLITEEILIPIAKIFLDVDENQLDSLQNIFGVDGEYGRHYSFLKAITAIWQVFVNDKVKGTFKIDLDQVFPNDELVEQSKASVFEHFKSPLWGAKGRDAHGNNVDLSMIAGALVNESDIEKSLFYPDVRFPTDNEINPEEHIFFSKLPQALSTEAEMMEKYNSENIDGKNSVLSRVHVTGGTNGILIKALRKYRPFTPSFVGRAEDQAYIMSVLFDGPDYLRYMHKSGLIMRHDKHSFAGDAIKAAETGKIIGDYVRILLFSNYAKMLPWSFKRIKSELNPFTGCFITNLPFTIVYLRFVLFISSLYNTENKQSINKANNLIKDGAPRLLDLIEKIESEDNILLQKYINERKGWHLFYDILDIAETQINANDEWMVDIKSKAEKILLSSKIN